MSKNLEAKKQLVEDISNELTNGTTFVFNYSKIGVNEINALRGDLAKTDTKLKVVKNTLITRIIEKMGAKVDTELQGQNAIVIPSTNDVVAPIKILFDFVKKNEKGAVVMGVLNGQTLTGDKVEAFSKLPSREVLLAQVLGGFNAPIRGFMYASKGVQGNFVRALNAIKEQKGA
jgi:large subunit ribosomal protein L10